MRSRPNPFASRSLWVGVYDALTARLVTEHGHLRGTGQPRGLWVSSYCVSAALRACPDASIVSPAEMVAVGRQVDLAANDTPVVLDCDCGYGDAVVFGYVVEEICRTSSIAAVCVEDKVFPKRNSFYVGHAQVLEPVEVFQEKIAAAVHARRRQRRDLAVVARTEALVVGAGVAAALDRLAAYADAGADALMVQARGPLTELREVGQTWSERSDVPLVVVPTLYPTMAPANFWDLGYSVYVYANQLLRVAGSAQERLLDHLLATDRALDVEPGSLWTLDELNALVDAYRIIEDDGVQFSVGPAAVEQYG